MVPNEGRCRSRWKQWLAALTMILPMATVGPLKILMEHNLHISNEFKDDPIELRQWSGLFMIIGCVIGAIFGAVSADMFGRKMTLLATTVSAVGGIINTCFTSPITSCVILLIGGINAGIACTVVPLYISEIADDKIRGRLLMLQLLGIYIGQFIVVIIVPLTGSVSQDIYSISIPILFLITMWWFPETPYHLVSKKQYAAAAKSLAFFRGIGQFAAKEEADVLINTVEENSSRQGISQRICELFHGPDRKGLIIVVLLIIMQWLDMCLNIRIDLAGNLQNVITIRFIYALIIICATQLIWSGILVFTIDIIGRRFYLLGSTLGALVIGSFTMVVITDRSYILFVTKFILHQCQIVTFGVPLVFVGELFSANVKSIASATVMIFTTIFKSFVFGIHWAVPELTDYGSYIFILIYLLAFIFILAFVPETKKKTIAEIQLALADDRLKCRSMSHHNQITRME